MRAGLIIAASGLLLLQACDPDSGSDSVAQFVEVVDLGTLVTEDLTEHLWGKRFVTERGFDRPNEFDVTRRNIFGGTLSNAYYTLFNHGGPHVDAPNHVGLEGGIDSYPIDVFAGPLKVIDVSNFPIGRTVTIGAFEDHGIEPGDIVLVFTGYTPPQSDNELPESLTLTSETAEYLAAIPIRAYGTDARSVASIQDQDPDHFAPVHHAFLSRGIPIYEQLFNVDQLLDKERMMFVGVPVNIKNGDGMLVRPVVLVY